MEILNLQQSFNKKLWKLKALEDIQTKLIEQEHILEEHHGLPPNIELANERVDAIKREIVRNFH